MLILYTHFQNSYSIVLTMKKFILFIFLFPGLLQAQEIKFPLRASANKKYIVDQSGQAVFLNGSSVWRLPFAISYDDAKNFLLGLKAKKFNAIAIQVAANSKSFVNETNGLTWGEVAFDDDDVTKPNEKYFRHLDSLLELCNQLNIAVLAAPLFLGCCGDDWLEVIQQYKDGVAKCRKYGEWFAQRYKHLPNIIWLSGGDHNPVPESIALAEGIASVDTTHLHTYHAHPGKSSGERFQGAKWHTLSSAYTYFPAMEMDTIWQFKHVYTMLYEEMLNKYGMPCILIESAYEKERYTTAQIIRRQAYWSILAGASGEIFGHRDMYQVNKKFVQALNDPGSESMKIFQTFVQSIPWYNMKGDWAHSLFITGRGTFNSTQYPGGEDYATAAFTPDSTLAILYMPSYRTVGINMNRFKKPVVIKWFDPSTGAYKTIPKTFPNKGISYIKPPSFRNDKGYDDWVLIVATKP